MGYDSLANFLVNRPTHWLMQHLINPFLKKEAQAKDQTPLTNKEKREK